MTMDDVKNKYACSETNLAGIGDYGCFFLSLLSIAEEHTGKPVDMLEAINWGKKEYVIGKDWYINDDIALLKHLTGERVRKRALTKLGDVKANDYTIEKWYNKRTGYNHFKRRYFDVLQDSVTVKEGTIVSYYLYTIG